MSSHLALQICWGFFLGRMKSNYHCIPLPDLCYWSYWYSYRWQQNRAGMKNRKQEAWLYFWCPPLDITVKRCCREVSRQTAILLLLAATVQFKGFRNVLKSYNRVHSSSCSRSSSCSTEGKKKSCCSKWMSRSCWAVYVSAPLLTGFTFVLWRFSTITHQGIELNLDRM